MAPLREGLACFAGYGVKIWLFAEDLGQPGHVYGRSATRSMVANTSLKTFACMDSGTQETVADMLAGMAIIDRRPSEFLSAIEPTTAIRFWL
jgi:type IV secretory pathway TraG/TraD family ATPase VirD4